MGADVLTKITSFKNSQIWINAICEGEWEHGFCDKDGVRAADVLSRYVSKLEDRLIDLVGGQSNTRDMLSFCSLTNYQLALITLNLFSMSIIERAFDVFCDESYVQDVLIVFL